MKVSNFRIFGVAGVSDTASTGGILIGPDIKFAQLQGLWLEGMDKGITGSGSSATVVIKDFKIKDVGYVWGSTNHQAGVISVNSPVLVISKGVFSHHRLRSWALRSNSQHLEFLCNVSLRTLGDSGMLIHLDTNKTVRVVGNYFQQNADSGVYFYQYRVNAAGTALDFDNNVAISDKSTSVIFSGPSNVVIRAKGNTFVGGATKLAISGSPVDMTTNQYFPSRAAAGQPDFPALPSGWPIDKY